MPDKQRQVSDLQPTIETFLGENRQEACTRYNRLLPEIIAAEGKGIISMHNLRYGSRGLHFGSAVQLLYNQNQGRPIEMPPAAPETTPAPVIVDIATTTGRALRDSSQPHPTEEDGAAHGPGDDAAHGPDDDASDIIAGNADY